MIAITTTFFVPDEINNSYPENKEIWAKTLVESCIEYGFEQWPEVKFEINKVESTE